MDIFNRPPAISEDTLQYTLYPSLQYAERASVTALAALILEYVDTLLPDHLWHRDTFQLRAVENEADQGYILEGHMRIGDCIDDEWCVVWLLREISSKWDIAISVSDTDGEFLLIEAAEHLPSWLSPENALNRVWIYNSHLHIVPLSYTSPPSSKPRRPRHVGLHDSDDEDVVELTEDEEYISVADALGVIRDSSVGTRASKQVEDAVVARIHGYPIAARQHIHNTKAYLPIDIAKALSVDPSLVQKPIETFYTRDALQLRAAHKMSRFPPSSSVLTSVKMTRTAYAQLLGQKFYPPKAFGRFKEHTDSPEWRWRDVGMKIACGFEMLYQESKGRATAISSSVAESTAEAKRDALQRDSNYSRYIQSLISLGYFKGEIRDSALWKQLEDKAVEAYIETRRTESSRPVFAVQVNTAVNGATASFIRTENEDSDDWLNIDATDFDAMLEKTMGMKDSDEMVSEDAEDTVANQQAERLRNLAKKVESFVEGEGDLEGARFEDDILSDEDIDENESMSVDSSDDDDTRQAAIARLVPGIEPSEYGKMPPSFHDHSQRTAKVSEDPDHTTNSNQHDHPIRPPIISRDKYDGVESDEETDDDDVEDEEEAEYMPQLVGDVEIDMEEEEEEFIEFARQALGMTNEQWHDIVKDREERGAYVPRVAGGLPEAHAGTGKARSANISQQEPLPKSNFDLNSFEAVMKAMDSELVRLKTDKIQQNEKRKGKQREEPEPFSQMDAELRDALDKEEIEGDTEESADYGLIKNFLESFKSQAGLPGPVSSLVGRLEAGWTLPRDV